MEMHIWLYAVTNLRVRKEAQLPLEQKASWDLESFSTLLGRIKFSCLCREPNSDFSVAQVIT